MDQEPAGGINKNPGGVQAPGQPPQKQFDPSGGGLPEYTSEDYNFNSQLPGTQKRDQIGGAFAKSLGGAQSYLQNLRGNSDKAFNSYAGVARNELAKSIQGTKNNFNSRGLLGSGLQGDAVARQTAGANADLDQKRSEINSGLLGNLATMEDNTYGLSSLMAQGGPDTANQYLTGIGTRLAEESGDSALASQMYGNAAQGAGALGGTSLAALMAGGGQKKMPNYYDFNSGSSWAGSTA
jgi:hypothetical protein